MSKQLLEEKEKEKREKDKKRGISKSCLMTRPTFTLSLNKGIKQGTKKG